ncbi:hypothetical protein L204_104988 [Cryptococcus depauperatus]|nr:hypothetical protein L204_03629 [Cryptococcus depauperatus CBS 7855]
MDRGAARSRKRALKDQKQVTTRISTGELGNGIPSNETKHQKTHPDKDGKPKIKKRQDPSQQSKDPSLYKAKAVRSAAALIYSENPFELPPPAESLHGVRRIDLSGSNVRDVEWLKGLNVTWLSLANCPVKEGWEAVGSLSELTVLNISGCGLDRLPPALKNLSKLKAVVAMHNQWNELDPEIVGSWSNLNSLIVSHSPNISVLPSSLSDLLHLAKLTFSHCPQLTACSLPDLSPLPLLRDIKMNNLPKLTSLPVHMSSWGKGNMALVGKSKDSSQYGHGLQTLDIGNCSLDYQSVSSIFGLTPVKRKPLWPHLRSISLHSNPIASSHTSYSEQLQSSSDLPILQIIDAHRVVERKRKGVMPESKANRRCRERREANMRPSGANTATGKMRSWGQESRSEDAHLEIGEKQTIEQAMRNDSTEKNGKEKKGQRLNEATPNKQRHESRDIEAKSGKNNDLAYKKRKYESYSGSTAPAPIVSTIVDPTEALRQPSAQEDTPKERRKDKSAVVGLIEVKGGEEVKVGANKRKKVLAKGQIGHGTGSGVDLKELFGKKDKAVENNYGENLGLNVSSW